MGKLYFKLLWGGVDDNEIARRLLSWIPDDFTGKLLNVPMGTAVFTPEKNKRCYRPTCHFCVTVNKYGLQVAK